MEIIFKIFLFSVLIIAVVYQIKDHLEHKKLMNAIRGELDKISH
jgi:hypothetical protein